MENLQISTSSDFRAPASIVAAIAVALAMSFAAGAASVSPESWAAVDAARISESGPIDVGPFEYFPGKYKNQATEIEPLPPQF